MCRVLLGSDYYDPSAGDVANWSHITWSQQVGHPRLLLLFLCWSSAQGRRLCLYAHRLTYSPDAPRCSATLLRSSPYEEFGGNRQKNQSRECISIPQVAVREWLSGQGASRDSSYS